MDRREVLYGKAVDGICDTLGYAFVPAYDDLNTPPTIEMEVPGDILENPATADLRDRSLWISLQYLNCHGNAAATQQALNSILSDWNGTTFGTLDPDGTCRDYGFVLHMLRATEIWKTSALALTVAQQVDAQMWTLQNPDGSMRVSLSSESVGGEEAGMTLVSHDPRVPQWFGYTSGSGGSTNCQVCTPGAKRVCCPFTLGCCQLGEQTCEANGTWGECAGATPPGACGNQ